ncbi:IclR family transcriptional regulator [Halogeometricum borinquense]|nr:IclR family transcriptional regulator [Halogeometricum borinquense]
MQGSNTAMVGATETSFDILQALRELGGAGVTETAEHLDIPKSTAHKHLHTLAQLGYVTNEDGTYDLGLLFVGLGQYVQANSALVQATGPVVERLAETTEAVAGFFVERGGRGFEVNQVTAGTSRDLDGGLSKYLHSTAPGKAILAKLPDERVDEIVDQHGLPALTPHTITTRSALEDELARIRDRGIAFDREENRVGMRGVAIPVVHDGIRGAMYVVGPQRRLTGKWFNENIPGIIISSVKTVEQRLREQD